MQSGSFWQADEGPVLQCALPSSLHHDIPLTTNSRMRPSSTLTLVSAVRLTRRPLAGSGGSPGSSNTAPVWCPDTSSATIA